MMEAVDASHAASLPPAAPRTHAHTRSIEYRGYRRDDGLWDIEAELTDTKTYAHKTPDRGMLPAGEPVHGMAIRLTVDDSLTITDVAVGMPATPFPECQGAKPPMQRLIGCTMTGGWRKSVQQALGGIQGCAHLRELLFNMATVAYQTIPHYRNHLRRLAGEPEPVLKKPPPHMGQCLAWDFNGPVVQRIRPEFAGWKAPESR
ncbi:MAG TPA: DUF2889 domain-containing protein [Burkholderiales bacterium]|nr:DUF2889 domain-containing protein [Burkholderiales bacterium]